MEFKKAVDIVLKLEGGFVNHPKDPGLETKYGISKRSYPDLDIKKLTKKQAREIYKKDYWDKCSCETLPEIMRLAVFDCAVNQGVSRALKFWDAIIISGIRGDEKKFVTYMDKRKSHYFKLKTFPVFGKGWINRLLHVYNETLLDK